MSYTYQMFSKILILQRKNTTEDHSQVNKYQEVILILAYFVIMFTIDLHLYVLYGTEKPRR